MFSFRLPYGKRNTEFVNQGTNHELFLGVQVDGKVPLCKRIKALSIKLGLVPYFRRLSMQVRDYFDRENYEYILYI